MVGAMLLLLDRYPSSCCICVSLEKNKNQLPVKYARLRMMHATLQLVSNLILITYKGTVEHNLFLVPVNPF